MLSEPFIYDAMKYIDAGLLAFNTAAGISLMPLLPLLEMPFRQKAAFYGFNASTTIADFITFERRHHIDEMLGQ